MDLLERYLAAVARELPEAQRADITAELRDLLMNRIEEKEAEVGHPLASGELEALLQAFGHPLTVAGRYRKTQHLVGPEVFPFWWKGVKLTLAWVAGVYLVLAILSIVAGRETEAVLDRAVPSLTFALVFTFGLVTLGAVAIERFGRTHFLQRWKARHLPPAEGRGRSQFDLVVEMAMGVVFLLWWTGVVHFQDLIPKFGLELALAPVWQTWFWPILAYGVLELGANLVALTRPGLARLNGGLTIARNLLGAAILMGVLRDGHFVDVASVRIPPQVLPQIETNIDLGMRIGLAATLIFMLWRAGAAAWRLRRTAQLSLA